MSFENKHSVRNRKEWPPLPSVNHRCAKCGVWIDRNGEWMANGSGFYCSDKCLMASERKNRKDSR